MRTLVDHSAMPAAGYVEPWSLRAGGTARLHLSCVAARPAIRIVRLDMAHIEPVGWPVLPLRAEAAVREIERGSWIALPNAPEVPFELRVEFRLTRNTGVKPIVTGPSVVLSIDETGHLALAAATAEARGGVLPRERWLSLVLTREAATCRAEVTEGSRRLVALKIAADLPGPGALRIGASAGNAGPSLNARIGRICLKTPSRMLAWRFPPRAPADDRVPAEDGGPALHVHGLPTFAVTSARWDGTILDPRLDADQYDAIHLHEDDDAGLDWPAQAEAQVPAAAPSGVYAFEVATPDGVERLPFFVRPASPTASLVFLAPTATYLAYADEALPPARFPWRADDRGQRFAAANGFLSLYDVHADLDGVALTTTRRPKATLRDDYRYPLSDSPHLLPVDLRLLRFLRANGIAVDVLTDHDLDAEGAAALAPYAGVVTGSHPEYWSARMRAALDAFLDGGGNLAYLGGNGFYWTVAIEGARMELRRGQDDIWSSRPGELHLQLTGEPGGAWAERGRPLSALVGSTYVIMSFGPARPYRRLPASEGAFAWVFEGVDGPIGAAGTVLGGAAGYELDAVADEDGAVVRLATADGFDSSFQVRPSLWLVFEADRERLRRADMTMRAHGGGGLVFGVGSVAWCGALPEPGGANAAGTITLNVARRFARKASSRRTD